jgi:hypothetical protein
METIANLKGSEEYIEEFHVNHLKKKKPKKLIFSLIELHPHIAAALQNLIQNWLLQLCMGN